MYILKTNKHTCAQTLIAVSGFALNDSLKLTVHQHASTLTLNTPLLYMRTSEKAKPWVSTLSNHPFIMAGTLNQYSGNCGSRDTQTHSYQFGLNQLPAAHRCLWPLTSDLEDDQLGRLHFALLCNDVATEAALLPGVHGLVTILEQLGVFALT